MIKHVLLAGAMTISVPALAQTAPTSTAPQAAPATTQATPADTAAPAADQPVTAQPADPAAPAQTAQQPAAGGDQVASVVDSEFPTYDTNGDGRLSQTEFAAWMTALKAETDPAAKPDTPAAKKWNQAAFAQADKDKSKTVSKAELTGFLAQGQS